MAMVLMESMEEKEMKGRFDTFTDAELHEMAVAFKSKGLNELFDEVSGEIDIRNEMSPVDRKVYDNWRGKFIKRCMKEEKSE